MLQTNWITEGHLDYEYKKYQALAYAQEVNEYFGNNRLYPVFAELLQHYLNLKKLKVAKEGLRASFKKTMKGMVLQNPEFKLLYNYYESDPEFITTLDQILDFSLPLFEKCANDGKKIFDRISALLQIIPVGIHPREKNEGYWLLSPSPEKQIHVYRYKIGIYTDSEGPWRSVETNFLGVEKYTFTNTPENIKLNLIKSIPDLPNPAVYTVLYHQTIPQQETLLPILRRVFIQRYREKTDDFSAL